jgi:hypothetical protein
MKVDNTRPARPSSARGEESSPLEGHHKPPSLREYRHAEERLKESLWLRCNGLPMHDYPMRRDDLRLITRFHAAYGVPPSGFLRRLLWFLKGSGGG